MKRPALAAVAALCFLLLPASRAVAQETGGGAVYGFTSLDYDSQTNQFTCYSETDADGIDCPYYITNVRASLIDPNGKQVVSQLGQNSPCTTATASFNYTPQVSGNYSLYGQHYLTLDQAYDCDEDGFEQNCWADYDDFSYWSDFEGVDYPWGTNSTRVRTGSPRARTRSRRSGKPMTWSATRWSCRAATPATI